MHNQLQFYVGNTSPSAASIYFTVRNGAKIISASGKFTGPHCEHARTLPADFKVRLSAHSAMQQSAAESTIIDPCYWSPALPFTYEVKIQLQTDEGQKIEYQGTLGIRRWHGEKKGFYLDSRRTVLRGCRGNEPDKRTTQLARLQELALLINPADQSFYQEANRRGIGLVVDLRKVGDSLSDHLHLLNWSPSVMVAIVSAEQLTQLGANQRPKQFLLAQCLTADSLSTEISEVNPDAFAVELNAGERPPAWLSHVEQPVIAIRQGGGGAQPPTPRHDCEVFQASLAPDFSLAGYFVSL